MNDTKLKPSPTIANPRRRQALAEEPSLTAAPEEKVGYKNPPKATRFKKGQSGNPKGRPKGRPNNVTILNDLLAEKMPARIQGKTRHVSALEAMMRRQIIKALEGDARSCKLVIEWLSRFAKDTPEDANEATNSPSFEDLSEEDSLIMQRILASFAGESEEDGDV